MTASAKRIVRNHLSFARDNIKSGANARAEWGRVGRHALANAMARNNRDTITAAYFLIRFAVRRMRELAP